MLDCKQLDAMSQMDVTAIDRKKLADLEDVAIDTNLPASVKMLRYLEQIKNPYCFMCGGIPVKVCFSPEGGDLADLLTKYFITLKQ